MTKKREFFVFSQSFAAPFLSNSGTHYVRGATPQEALVSFAATYEHPAGLYSAGIWNSADDYHKKRKPLATWTCNQADAIARATKRLPAYSFRSNGPGEFEVDGKIHRVEGDPKSGAIR